MLSLLVFLPAINLVIIIMLGFMKWPIESQLEAYRKKHGPLEKKEKDFDNLPVCVKCQTPLPPGAKNCIACGWPDNYKGI